MKCKKIIILTIIFISFFTISYGTDEIISSQMESLNIFSFIKEGEQYTKQTFPDLNLNHMLNSAISGEIDNSLLTKGIIRLLGKEVVNTLTLFCSILIIIVVHSILKSICENIGNENISGIAYYIEYILIVTLIMANFSELISMIKETITNMVGLMNTLIPILLALLTTTGNIASTAMIQPIILFAVVFVGNIITVVILPITIVGTVLGIVSQISEKVQIGKLAKFFKSSITWFLGFVIVIFVGILSLEGTITSTVDGITAKGVKIAVSTFVPVVGKALGDSVDTVLRLCFTFKKCNWNCRNSTNNQHLRIANN